MEGDSYSQYPASASEARWSQLWQLPILLAGVLLFGVGLWMLIQNGSAPNYASYLDQAHKNIEAGELEKAQKDLDTFASLIESAPVEEQARYWQYWADHNYLSLQMQVAGTIDYTGGDAAKEQILNYYAKSQRLGRALDQAALRRYARTYALLGKTNEALALVDQLSPEDPSQRYRIVRELIERRLREAPEDHTTLTRLLLRFDKEISTEPLASARRQQEVWITAVRGKRLLAVDNSPEAIRLLHARILQLTAEKDDRDLAPLYVVLAQAYQQQGTLDPRDLNSAEQYYRQADQRLANNDPMRSEVLVGLAELSMLRDDPQSLQQAHELFNQAVQQYPSEPATIAAMIGKGDTEAKLGQHSQAQESFLQAAERLADFHENHPHRESLFNAVQSHVATANDRGEYKRALALLNILQPLNRLDPPPEMLYELAITHQRIAQDMIEKASQVTQYRDIPTTEEVLSPAAAEHLNQQAAVHYDKAAEYYLQHAAATTLSPDDTYGQSLWAAATCFDHAQNWDRAIETYSRFVKTHERDPRLLRARKQLGQSLLASGQAEAALIQFDELIDHHPQAPETIDVLVPRALALMAMGDRDKAITQLQQVVTDHDAIRPESSTYRGALIELGKLHYRKGATDSSQYVPAIERLTEAVDRYPEAEGMATARYYLADAYRLSALSLLDKLDQSHSHREQLATQAEQRKRLEQAQMFFNQVIHELEARRPETLSALERLIHRNAWFYQADCAFDRGQFEVAIDLYSKAAERWRRDPAALIARVQIVNAYSELGRVQDARAANRIALNQLKSIPEKAFEDSNLPMTKRHWEDWLRWTNEHNLAPAQGG